MLQAKACSPPTPSWCCRTPPTDRTPDAVDYASYQRLLEYRIPKIEQALITWFGMLAPAKTPKAILGLINDAFTKVISAPELRTRLEAQGAGPGSGSTQAFAALIRREYERNAKVVKTSGARID